MEAPVVAGIALVVLLILVRRFAARRVVARQGWFVWLMFLPTLFGAGAIVWAAIRMIASEPIVGALLAILGVIYAAVVVRFLTLLARSVSASGPQDDLGAVTTEPLVDYMTSMVGLVLIGGLIALVGLIIWGIGQAAR